MAVADFTGDGFLDLAAASDVNAAVLLLRGTGAGTFAAAISYPVKGSTAMVAADFNGDNRPDLAVTTSASSVSLLLSQGCVP